MRALLGPLFGAGFAFLGFEAWDYVPVVWGMEAHAMHRESDMVTATVYGRKMRDCAVVKGSVIGWYERGGVWFEIENFGFLEDRSPESTRPRGKQSFGIWQWAGVHAAATRVKMTLEHDCNGDIRVTTSGPFILD